MAKLPVRLTVASTVAHPVITGFVLLEQAGVVDLDLRLAAAGTTASPSPAIIEAQIAGRVAIAYDLEDGYIIDWTTRDRYLETLDFCFKRSYNEMYHAPSAFGSRIRPLGLIFDVTAKHRFFRRVRMADPGRYARFLVKRALGIERTPYWWRFEDVPRHSHRPLVLFAARTWDPDGEKGEYIGDRALARQDREPLNDMRAECVRLLRKEFGSAFVGGLVPTAHARAWYPDCVMDAAATRRANFLELIKRSDVCIATRGLFESTGAKLAEYLAASKAVVSERLHYHLPGEFVQGRNYLEFDDPEGCVEQAALLCSEPARAFAMKVANYRYYHTHVRPDRLVLNTLTTALEAA